MRERLYLDPGTLNYLPFARRQLERLVRGSRSLEINGVKIRLRRQGEEGYIRLIGGRPDLLLARPAQGDRVLVTSKNLRLTRRVGLAADLTDPTFYDSKLYYSLGGGLVGSLGLTDLVISPTASANFALSVSPLAGPVPAVLLRRVRLGTPVLFHQTGVGLSYAGRSNTGRRRLVLTYYPVLPGSAFEAMVAHSEDNGKTWTESPMPHDFLGTTYLLWPLLFYLGGTSVATVGQSSGAPQWLRSSDGGSSWSATPVPTLSFFGSNRRVYFAVIGPQRLVMLDNNPPVPTQTITRSIWFSDDGGQSWQGPAPVATDLGDRTKYASIFTVQCTGPGEVLVVASETTDANSPVAFFRSIDGGHTFTQHPPPSPALRRRDLSPILTLRPGKDPGESLLLSEWYFPGEGDFLVRSKDSGATWKRIQQLGAALSPADEAGLTIAQSYEYLYVAPTSAPFPELPDLR